VRAANKAFVENHEKWEKTIPNWYFCLLIFLWSTNQPTNQPTNQTRYDGNFKTVVGLDPGGPGIQEFHFGKFNISVFPGLTMNTSFLVFSGETSFNHPSVVAFYDEIVKNNEFNGQAKSWPHAFVNVKGGGHLETFTSECEYMHWTGSLFQWNWIYADDPICSPQEYPPVGASKMLINWLSVLWYRKAFSAETTVGCLDPSQWAKGFSECDAFNVFKQPPATC
jgi:hypothetical protein